VNNADVLWPIQTAIYTTVTGDATLMGKITGVFDEKAPDGQPFDYLTIGSATSTPQGAHDRFGARTTVTLHAWSTYAGRRQVTSIASDLLRLLDHQTLQLDGHNTIVVRHEQTVTVPDPDPDIRHLAVRFALETELQAA